MSILRKNDLTDFDKILNRPDCMRENCCPKNSWRPCQILSNFYKLGAKIFQSPSNGSYGNLSSNREPFVPAQLTGRAVTLGFKSSVTK